MQERLLAILRDDVHRLDRLITDIAEASRLDAQLSRAKFEEVDVPAMVAGLIAQRTERGIERGVRIRFDNQARGRRLVMGEGARLERVFENLFENAVSFSPDDGLIAVGAAVDGGDLVVRVEDEGPGVPTKRAIRCSTGSSRSGPKARSSASIRGSGSPLRGRSSRGIRAAIVVESREDRLSGARFVVRLPLAPSR